MVPIKLLLHTLFNFGYRLSIYARALGAVLTSDAQHTTLSEYCKWPLIDHGLVLASIEIAQR